ncbi:hypothetical protein [Photobacterium kishitanii]|uniref:Uncharacterized protein n=1 Tax=Photobacterium kishitanii TaxID=318456 RepID=A0A2T3KLY9_9GAMM|nr:hypothetical protein [Photobacterium kishitanii]PSV00714.1 hypothetical protein C9J27_06115 [Photobacterium kishitanii]
MIIRQFRNACLFKRNMITFQQGECENKQYKLILLARAKTEQINELLHQCAIGEMTVKEAISKIKLDKEPPKNAKTYTEDECPTYKWHSDFSDMDLELQKETEIAFNECVQKYAEELLEKTLIEMNAIAAILSYQTMITAAEKDVIIYSGKTLKKSIVK